MTDGVGELVRTSEIVICSGVGVTVIAVIPVKCNPIMPATKIAAALICGQPAPSDISDTGLRLEDVLIDRLR